MSTAKWQNIAGSKKFFNLSTLYQGKYKLGMLYIVTYIIVRVCGTEGTESILP